MANAQTKAELIASVTAAFKRRRKLFDKDTLASEKQSTQAICDLLNVPDNGKPDTRWKALPRPVLYELARDAFECDANADGDGPAGMTLYSLREGNHLESGERITAAMAQDACRALRECGDDTVLCSEVCREVRAQELLFTVKDVSKRLHITHTTVFNRLKKLTAQDRARASTRVGRKRGGTRITLEGLDTLREMKADGRKRGPKLSTRQRERREKALAECRELAAAGNCTQVMLASALGVTQGRIAQRLGGRPITAGAVDELAGRKTTAHAHDLSDAELDALLA